MMLTTSRCDHIESVRMNKFEQATEWAGAWVGAKMSKVNVSLWITNWLPAYVRNLGVFSQILCGHVVNTHGRPGRQWRHPPTHGTRPTVRWEPTEVGDWHWTANSKTNGRVPFQRRNCRTIIMDHLFLMILGLGAALLFRCINQPCIFEASCFISASNALDAFGASVCQHKNLGIWE